MSSHHTLFGEPQGFHCSWEGGRVGEGRQDPHSKRALRLLSGTVAYKQAFKISLRSSPRLFVSREITDNQSKVVILGSGHGSFYKPIRIKQECFRAGLFCR